MKKILLFLFLILSFSIVSKDISFEGEFPASLMEDIESAIIQNSEGRGESSFIVSSYSSDESRISFRINDSLIVIMAGENKDISQEVYASIENLLFYDSSLYQEGDVLDYIYKNSYSYSPSKENRAGTTISAVDTNGHVRGVFEVKGSYEGYDVLRPLYLDRALPGIALEDSGAWRYAISAAASFDFSDFAIWAEAGNTSWIYPFIPTFAAGYSTSEGKAFAGIGIEGYLFLNTVFPELKTTFIEEGRIGGSAFLTLGASSSGVSLGSMYSIYYEHRFLPYFLWRAGYTLLPSGRSGISLSIGGAF